MVELAQEKSERSWPYQRSSSPSSAAFAVVVPARTYHFAAQSAGSQSTAVVAAATGIQLPAVVGSLGIEAAGGIGFAVVAGEGNLSLAVAFLQGLGNQCIAVAPAPGRNPVAECQTEAAGLGRTVAGHMAFAQGERWAHRRDRKTSQKTWSLKTLQERSIAKALEKEDRVRLTSWLGSRGLLSFSKLGTSKLASPALNANFNQYIADAHQIKGS